MNLTTVERIRALVMAGANMPGQDLNASTVAALNQIISEVSAQAEAELDRYAQTGERTEYLDIEPGQCVFSLRAYPVSAVAGIWYDPEQEWSGDAIAANLYRSPVYDRNGLLRLDYQLNWSDIPRQRALKVTYTGGMAADTAAFMAAFPDITSAVSQQVYYLWTRRHDLGLSSSSGIGGTVTQAEVTWLPTAMRTLKRHRRIHAA